MTVPDQAVAVAAPPELRVDAAKVINSLKQRLLDEISKAVMLEAALADSQERERSLSFEVTRLNGLLQEAPGPPGDAKQA